MAFPDTGISEHSRWIMEFEFVGLLYSVSDGLMVIVFSISEPDTLLVYESPV